MGQPKLLLPWRGRRLIDSVLEAWTTSDVSATVIIVREDDAELQEACQLWAVDVALPARAPRDMKASLQYGLRHIEQRFSPTASDSWVTAPADLPNLDSVLVNRVVDAARQKQSIIAPKFGDRSGHPVLFPWHFADRVFRLGPEEGINTILASEDVHYIQLPAADRPTDIDTPEEYRQLRDSQPDG